MTEHRAFTDVKKLKIKYLEKHGIVAEKRIHQGWTEHKVLKDSGKMTEDYKKYLMINRPLGHFHKWQFIFTSKKGSISLVCLYDYWRIGEHIWEIYCLEGEIFEDVERYKYRKDAIKAIVELLR